MDPADLRPLRVGEILDAAISIYRRRFGTLVRAVAVAVAPVAVISLVVELSASGDLDADAVDGGDVAAVVGAGLITALLGVISSQLATAAAFTIVSGDYLDESPTWQESLRDGLRRLRSLVWLTILYGLAVALGFLACIVPGVYLMVAFAVAVPALLFEDARGAKALRRSRSLLRGRWWPAAAVLGVSMILTSIVNAGLQGVVAGLLSGGGSDGGAALAGAVANVVGSILTTPFSAAVATVLYFDARVRKEGFDLELLARRIGVEPPVLPPGDPFRPVADDDEPPFWPPPPGWRPKA